MLLFTISSIANIAFVFINVFQFHLVIRFYCLTASNHLYTDEYGIKIA